MKKKDFYHILTKTNNYTKKTLIPKKQTDEAFCDDITFHILQTPLFMMCTMQVVGFFLIQKKINTFNATIRFCDLFLLCRSDKDTL